jgi:hypothetical protein
MINPKEVTKFDRTQAELEEFILFCIIVAGKNSHIQAKKLEAFLSHGKWELGRKPQGSPFDIVWNRYKKAILHDELKYVKIGQYKRIEKAFINCCLTRAEIPDLNNWTLPVLEVFLGPKTARFFLLHTKPDQNVAVLDTHILKYMRDKMGLKVPKSTPSGKRYRELEKILLDHVASLGLTMAEFDLTVWKSYAK